VVEAKSSLAVAMATRQAARPGWTVLAADAYGLPWAGMKTRGISHGTWVGTTSAALSPS
jgi:hypothetical protein